MLYHIILYYITCPRISFRCRNMASRICAWASSSLERLLIRMVSFVYIYIYVYTYIYIYRYIHIACVSLSLYIYICI